MTQEGVTELIALRRFLRDFCTHHARSVTAFKVDGTDPKFGSREQERAPTGRRKPGKEHLTTTATCIESLLDCPPRGSADANEKDSPPRLAQQFAAKALRLRESDWVSEATAKIYCTCRALPLVIARAGSIDANGVAAIERRLDALLVQLDQVPTRNGVGESTGERPEDWYPENAFHTYWVLEILARLQSASDRRVMRILEKKNAKAHWERMLLWAFAELGRQVALHATHSPELDSDQLAWSLAIRLKHGRGLDAADRDMVRQGLHCLFAEQLPIGVWRRHRPLFHYEKAGEAYCYPFETMSVLLKAALSHGSEFPREILREHVEPLHRVISYAWETRIPLRAAGGIGWCSGHNPARTQPEGWATASVFSFAQVFRKLVGVWARTAARGHLPMHAMTSISEPLRRLRDRGDSWTVNDRLSVAHQLVTLFVNPLLKAGYYGNKTADDPDEALISKSQARSAVLFGPPGTGKTTLVRLVASALAWDFVEIHAADFLRDGADRIHATAEEIFSRVMQLDHAVVFFDEVDGLVRERTGQLESFERFLTTSMLPRLAELWDQRRILYFVATNHIKGVDPAIRRPQRFDALIMVPPPSCECKLRELHRLSGRTFNRPSLQTAVTAALNGVHKAAAEAANAQDASNTLLDRELALAKFALLRWDQIPGLARLLKLPSGGKRWAGVAAVQDALIRFSDPDLDALSAYADFLTDCSSDRCDDRVFRVWRVNLPHANKVRAACIQQFGIELDGNRAWLKLAGSTPAIPEALSGFISTTEAGILDLSGWKTRRARKHDRRTR